MTLADLPTVTVEIGFTSNTGSYLILDSTTAGILDTNRLAAGTGAVPSWSDVSAYVQSFSTHRGRNRQLDRFGAGTCEVILKNTDGRFSPTNLAGPYVSSGVTGVRPGVAVRIRATWNGTIYSIFYGYVESWKDTFLADAPNAMATKLQASDGFRRLARFEGLAQSPVGASELSGARCTRVLDNAGWDAGLRDLDTGQTTLQATTLEGNALSLLQLVADSENGEIYISADGLFVFDQRYIRITDSRSSTSQATFGDSGADLRYNGISPAYDDELVKNRAQYTRSGGSTQTYDDTSSQADNGILTDTRGGLLNESDSEVLAAAGWVVGRFAQPEQRVDQIELRPRRDPSNLWPQALGRQIRDRITVGYQPAAGDAIAQEVFIEGVSHDFEVSSSAWITRFDLSSASAWLPFFILDSSSQGVLDTNRLAY